jgi:folate-dependent phosphoribosylglycinamide formyltransferase PurN
MKIVLLATDDEFAGEMQWLLYEDHPEWIVGSILSSSLVYKRSPIGAFLFILRVSGLVFLTEMIRLKLLNGFLHRKSRCFPSRLARSHRVDLFVSSNINDEPSIARLRSWKPDLIISTNFNHYIGRTARESVARYGCWNLHKSLLPHYRGMSPSFYALLEGATKVGATLHVVAKGFDAGDVLAQVEVPVLKTDSVYSLNRKTAGAGGSLLATYLENWDPRSAKATAQPAGAWKNYTYPTRAEVRLFRKKRLKFYAPGFEEPASGGRLIGQVGLHERDLHL